MSQDGLLHSFAVPGSASQCPLPSASKTHHRHTGTKVLENKNSLLYFPMSMARGRELIKFVKMEQSAVQQQR